MEDHENDYYHRGVVLVCRPRHDCRADGRDRSWSNQHDLVIGGRCRSGRCRIPGATISLLYLPSPSAKTYSYLTTTTDANGNYAVTFDAVPDAIDGGLAFAALDETPGYAFEYRYVRINTRTAVYNFAQRPAVLITAGQTIELTVAADDSICDNNVQDTHPWPLDQEWVCHTILVTAPAAGNLSVQLLPKSAQPLASSSKSRTRRPTASSL